MPTKWTNLFERFSLRCVLVVLVRAKLIDSLAESGNGYGEKQDFPTMILENLKTAGVRQAHKEAKTCFTLLAPERETICW